MKLTGKIALSAALIAGCAQMASAQYYDMANQAVNMLNTALQGGFNYRGMVDASFTYGIGRNGCSSLEISTTQGFKYGSWFYMGVGAGVNVMFGGYNDDDVPAGWHPGQWGDGFDPHNKVHDTGVIIPLYSDFRFQIGKDSDVAGFIDLKAGAAFLIGKSYLRTPDGYLDNSEGFYFKPTIGMRIPVNSKDARQAFNVGVSYQLITTDSWGWGGYYEGTTVNSLGVSLGYEW
ncbi:MAG: hypothetical protein J6L73_02865 [Muribaculaceae bacterium]|nr:hypothetical protein [Muribaculaceae bacterium]